MALARVAACNPAGQLIKENINDGRRIQREYLANEQAADNGNTQRPP